MERPKNGIEQALDLMEPVVGYLGRDTGSLGEAATISIAISMKRIADAFDSSDTGGRPQGTVLWWLETIAIAAVNGRN